MSADPSLPGVVQSDREALARALAKRQQLGWQSSSIAWQQQPPTSALLTFVVDQGLGKIDLQQEDTIPWVVTLKPWFRTPNANTPEGPLSGRRLSDSIRARITYGAGALGPQEILVDWPGSGTSLIVNGSSVQIDVVGVASFPDPYTVADVNRLPRNFGAYASPARGHGATAFQAPTHTVGLELVSASTALIPVPAHATALELHAEWSRIVRARLDCLDDATGGVRITSIHYRAASAPDPVIATPTWGTPVRLPWWCRQVRLGFDAPLVIVLATTTTIVATAGGVGPVNIVVAAGTYSQASLAALINAGLPGGATFAFVANVARFTFPAGAFLVDFTPPPAGTPPPPLNELSDVLGYDVPGNRIQGTGPMSRDGVHAVTEIATAAYLMFHLTP